MTASAAASWLVNDSASPFTLSESDAIASSCFPAITSSASASACAYSPPRRCVRARIAPTRAPWGIFWPPAATASSSFAAICGSERESATRARPTATRVFSSSPCGAPSQSICWIASSNRPRSSAASIAASTSARLSDDGATLADDDEKTASMSSVDTIARPRAFFRNARSAPGRPSTRSTRCGLTAFGSDGAARFTSSSTDRASSGGTTNGRVRPFAIGRTSFSPPTTTSFAPSADAAERTIFAGVIERARGRRRR